MASESRRFTKIIATVGPACLTEDKLLKLIEAGVDMFRFNFAHGTREEHAQRIALVKELADGAGKPVGTLADISGPKIRLGKIPEETFELKEGETVTFVSPGVNAPGLPVQLKDFDQYIQPGDHIYLADGTRRLTATTCGGGIVTALVEVGGPVVSFKGINLPFLRKPLPAVCDKDMADIECAIDAGIDWIGLSFVGGAEDVEPVRKLMEKKGARRRVLAKLERRQALDHLDEIVVAFDGVMVARGDLGIEVEFEKVPIIQDSIIKAARSRGKPVIVATQILLSMIHNPRPTRAEVTDISHAVSGGADALMLSEETAVGEFGPEAVNTIARVAVVAESMNPPELQQLHSVHKEETALAHTAAVLAKNTGASVILCPTRSGNAARGVARFRPRQPIMVVSDQNEVVGGLTLYRGVYPVHADLPDNLDMRVKIALQLATQLGYAGPGDRVVIVGGVPAGSGRTNLLLTHTIPGN